MIAHLVLAHIATVDKVSIAPETLVASFALMSSHVIPQIFLPLECAITTLIGTFKVSFAGVCGHVSFKMIPVVKATVAESAGKIQQFLGLVNFLFVVLETDAVLENGITHVTANVFDRMS
jgi:hypothetical protein